MRDEIAEDDWQRHPLGLDASCPIEVDGVGSTMLLGVVDDEVEIHVPRSTTDKQIRRVIAAAAVAVGLEVVLR